MFGRERICAFPAPDATKLKSSGHRNLTELWNPAVDFGNFAVELLFALEGTRVKLPAIIAKAQLLIGRQEQRSHGFVANPEHAGGVPSLNCVRVQRTSLDNSSHCLNLFSRELFLEEQSSALFREPIERGSNVFVNFLDDERLLSRCTRSRARINGFKPFVERSRVRLRLGYRHRRQNLLRSGTVVEQLLAIRGEAS